MRVCNATDLEYFTKFGKNDLATSDDLVGKNFCSDGFILKGNSEMNYNKVGAVWFETCKDEPYCAKETEMELFFEDLFFITRRTMQTYNSNSYEEDSIISNEVVMIMEPWDPAKI